MNKYFIVIIVVQIAIVTYLLLIIRGKENILGTANINPIKKETLSLNTKSNLKYFYEPRPDSTIEEIMTDWVGRDISYTINSDSFHEAKNYSEIKAKDVFRIITLGDSFVFGMFVNTSENWTEIIEDKLNLNPCSGRKYEVINLGVSGYDIEYSVERYRLRGMKYNPDLIIWLLKDDDFDQPNEIMLAKQKEVVSSLKADGTYDKLVKEGKPYPFVHVLHDYMTEYRKEVGQKYIYDRGVMQFNKLFSYYKNPLLTVVFPDMKEEYKTFLSGRSQNLHNLQLRDKYETNEILTYAPDDNHPNTEGHKEIANDIFNYLNEKQIICQ